jgi:hypothetical protein
MIDWFDICISGTFVIIDIFMSLFIDRKVNLVNTQWFSIDYFPRKILLCYDNLLFLLMVCKFTHIMNYMYMVPCALICLFGFLFRDYSCNIHIIPYCKLNIPILILIRSMIHNS